MGHEVVRIGAVENDDCQRGGFLHAPDDQRKLVDAVGVEEIDRTIFERDSPVGVGDLVDGELRLAHRAKSFRVGSVYQMMSVMAGRQRLIGATAGSLGCRVTGTVSTSSQPASGSDAMTSRSCAASRVCQ